MQCHIFAAFKPPNMPLSNMAEVGHATMASVGKPYVTVLQTAGFAAEG